MGYSRQIRLENLEISSNIDFSRLAAAMTSSTSDSEIQWSITQIVINYFIIHYLYIWGLLYTYMIYRYIYIYVQCIYVLKRHQKHQRSRLYKDLVVQEACLDANPNLLGVQVCFTRITGTNAGGTWYKLKV